MNPLFTALPDSLQSLTDDELQALADGHVKTFAAIKARDPETLGDRTMAQIIEESKAGKEAYALIQAEQQARVDAENSFDSEIATLTADIPGVAELDADTDGEADSDAGGDDGADGDTSDGGEGEGEGEGDSEALEADSEAATVTASVRRPLPRPARKHAPSIVEEPDTNTGPRQVPLIAASNLYGDLAGKPLTKDGLDEALCAAINQPIGGRQVFARANWLDAIPEERRLRGTDSGSGNTRKINTSRDLAFNETQALVAAGGQGNCAPLTPYYQLQVISVQDRPVRDALTGFTADRGGITYMPPPSLADFTDNGAVGRITEADQALGGTFATKTCAIVECSDIVSVQVDQIYKCLQFGNLQSRAYPEFVAQQNQLALSEWARLADTLLLDSIKAGSVHVTGLDVAAQGAVNNYLGDLIQAAAGIRSNNRMSADAPLQAIAPLWVRDMLVLDIARGQFDRFDWAITQIDALLAKYRINMAWTLDGSSTGGQVFGVQTAGALHSFPTTAETAIFPPGTWLFLDGGTLDLGIVRDSTLNSINAYQLFAETFEHAAKVGVVSYWLTSTLCANGAVAIPKDSAAYCA